MIFFVQIFNSYIFAIWWFKPFILDPTQFIVCNRSQLGFKAIRIKKWEFVTVKYIFSSNSSNYIPWDLVLISCLTTGLRYYLVQYLTNDVHITSNKLKPFYLTFLLIDCIKYNLLRNVINYIIMWLSL